MDNTVDVPPMPSLEESPPTPDVPGAHERPPMNSFDPFTHNVTEQFDPFAQRGGGTGTDAGNNYFADRLALLNPTGDTVKDIQSQKSFIEQLPETEALQKSLQSVKDSMYSAIDRSLDINSDEDKIKRMKKINEVTHPQAAAAAAIVQQYSGDATSAIKKDRYFRQIQLGMAYDFMEKAGINKTFGSETLGTVQGILGMLIPGRQNVESAWYNKTTPWGGYYMTKENIRAYQALSNEERVARQPELMEAIAKETHNNKTLFMGQLMQYITPAEAGNLFSDRAWDASAILPVGTGVKFVRYVTAANTPIKIIRDLGDIKQAAKLSAEALESKNAADTLRTSQHTAAQNMSPFQGEGFDPDVTNVLAADQQQYIAQRRAELLQKAGKLLDADNAFVLHRTVVDESEYASKNAKLLSQFAGKARVIEQKENGVLIEVETHMPTPDELGIPTLERNLQDILERRADNTASRARMASHLKGKAYTENPDVLRLQDENYDLIAQQNKAEALLDRARGKIPAEPPPPERTFVHYGTDDNGVFNVTEYNGNRFVNSASVIIGSQARGLVEKAAAINLTTDQIKATMAELLKSAFKDLKGGYGIGKFKTLGSADRVNAWLLQGDTDKIARYSAQDLISGVMTPQGLIKAKSLEDIVGYNNGRDLFELLHPLKEELVARELEAQNFKRVRMFDPQGNPADGFVREAGGLNDIPPSVQTVYDAQSRSLKPVSQLVSMQGSKAYKLKYPLEYNGEFINWVVEDPQNLRSIRSGPILNKLPGYVTKINKDVFYVADRYATRRVDGVLTHDFAEPVRFFNSKAEADVWAQQQKLAGEDIRIRSASELSHLTPEARDHYESQVFGGTYTGQRAAKPIPFGLAGTATERLSAYHALEQYMNHIAAHMPAVEFRLGLIEKFMKTVESQGAKFAIRGDWRSDVVGVSTGAGSRETQALKAMQWWVRHQIQIPTTEERGWQALMQRVSLMFEGKPINPKIPFLGQRPSVYALRLGSRNIWADMRATSFHTLLGWFNPRQLFVQAAGASLIYSLAPLKAGLITRRYMALAGAVASKNPATWRRYAKAAGISETEFEHFVDMYKRTGLDESTYTSADLGASMGLDSGPFGIKQIARKGLFFYSMGERFLRRTAVILAEDNLVARGALKRGKRYSDMEVDKILALSRKYSINLDRANAAYWQKGILSVPTQFLQNTAKFMENLYFREGSKEGGWTAADKSHIMVGQIILYGAAGVPFATWALQGIAQWAKGEGNFGLAIKDPALIRKLQGGFTDWLVSQVFGEPLSVSKSVSSLQNFSDFMENVMSQDKSTVQLMTGAFGQIPARAFQAVVPVIKLLRPDTIEFINSSTIVEAAHNLAGILSTYRNINTARMWMYANRITDTHGNTIFYTTDAEADRFALAKALFGFNPRESEDYYEAKAFVKAGKQEVQDVVNAYVETQLKAANSGYMDNPKYVQMIQTQLNLLMNSLHGEDQVDAQKLITKRLLDDKGAIVKVMTDAADQLMRKRGDSSTGNIFHPGIELNSSAADPNLGSVNQEGKR